MENSPSPSYLWKEYGNKGRDYGNFDAIEIMDEFSQDIYRRDEEHD